MAFAGKVMVQEIITYMIIGAAIALAVSRVVQKFKVKKRPEKKINYQKEKFTYHHDCSDCSAECMLRDASKSIIKENADLCNRLEKKRKL
jgi:hypothetical protein